jgi:hypothetical protein
MRFMLLQFYEPSVSCDVPIFEWDDPADIQAHIEFQQELNALLTESGEFVDAQGLEGPEAAKQVLTVGGATTVTDGPYAESKELLAGYRTIEVDSLERALEIAGQASAAPGPKGQPLGTRIEVRQVLGAPTPE